MIFQFLTSQSSVIFWHHLSRRAFFEWRSNPQVTVAALFSFRSEGSGFVDMTGKEGAFIPKGATLYSKKRWRKKIKSKLDSSGGCIKSTLWYLIFLHGLIPRVVLFRPGNEARSLGISTVEEVRTHARHATPQYHCNTVQYRYTCWSPHHRQRWGEVDDCSPFLAVVALR